MQIDLGFTTHKFEKVNLVSKKDGSDDYKCSLCNLKGNRPALQSELYTKSGSALCPKGDNAPPASVEITKYNGNIPGDGNLKPGTVHAVIEPPAEYAKDNPNTALKVWVMNESEPQMLLAGEFAPVAPDATVATDTPPATKKTRKSTAKKAERTIADTPTTEQIVDALSDIPGTEAHKEKAAAEKADSAPDPVESIVFDDEVDAAIMEPQHIESLWKMRTAQMIKSPLTAEQQERLIKYETAIEDGLKTYVVIGKYLFAIWNEKLFLGEFTGFREYIKSRWDMSATGAYDLMKAYRTWRLASADAGMSFTDAVAPSRWLNGKPDDQPEVDDSKPKSDTDAPSQRAIDEMAKFVPFLDRAEMSDADFAEFEKMALRYLYETVLELSGGQVTQKVVREVMDAFVEFAKSRAFEIEGDQVDASAADFRITKGVLERMMADKERIRTEWDERRARMSKPMERPHSENDFVADPAADPATVPILQLVRCSHHGDQDIIKIMFGAIQLSCGDVFGFVKGVDGIQFNPKLTTDNPIDEDEA